MNRSSVSWFQLLLLGGALVLLALQSIYLYELSDRNANSKALYDEANDLNRQRLHDKVLLRDLVAQHSLLLKSHSSDQEKIDQIRRDIIAVGERNLNNARESLKLSNQALIIARERALVPWYLRFSGILPSILIVASVAFAKVGSCEQRFYGNSVKILSLNVYYMYCCVLCICLGFICLLIF